MSIFKKAIGTYAIGKTAGAIKDGYDRIRDVEFDGVYDRFGLQRKPSTTDIVLPALGIFGAGLAVGASLGVLFAPKPGPELRQDVKRKLPEKLSFNSNKHQHDRQEAGNLGEMAANQGRGRNDVEDQSRSGLDVARTKGFDLHADDVDLLPGKHRD